MYLVGRKSGGTVEEKVKLGLTPLILEETVNLGFTTLVSDIFRYQLTCLKSPQL
jgi:hypothetical protein